MHERNPRERKRAVAQTEQGSTPSLHPQSSGKANLKLSVSSEDIIAAGKAMMQFAQKNPDGTVVVYREQCVEWGPKIRSWKRADPKGKIGNPLIPVPKPE